MSAQAIHFGRWFRFPFVVSTIGGAVLLGVAGWCWFQSIRFAARGVVVTARVTSNRSETIGFLGSWNGRPRAIRSRRVDYEFEDLDGKTRTGSDAWNGRDVRRGDLIEIEFLRADPESNRVHADFGTDWLGGLLFLAVGGVVLASPRFSRPHSKREAWNEFQREHRAASDVRRHDAPGSSPTSGKSFAFLGCIAAFVITAWAAICIVAAFATSEFRPILVHATGWSLLSLVLLLAAWYRLERGTRVFAVLIAIADLVILCEAIARWVG